MSSLSAALSIATGALEAEQGAMDATTNNVANSNTPGYSRVEPVLVSGDPVVLGSLTFGSGVVLQQLQSIRDPILQMRIQEETQQQSQLNTYVGATQQVQTLFNSTGSDIGSEISNFFSSVSQLATDPTNLSVRQGVLTAAGNLATAFNNTANSLSQQRSSLDLTVGQTVAQINSVTSQIAALNTQISSLADTGKDASSLQDQRDVLIGQLSGLVDVHQIQTENNGLTLTTSDGTALVTGGQNFALSTQTNASGFQDVYSQGTDITGNIVSGQLGGLLEARDQTIPSLLSSLDTLASGLANNLNSANASGFDLNGLQGGDIFVAPAGVQGAAANLAVQMTDPAGLAASSDGSSGSDGNVANLSAVQNSTVISGETPTDFYSNLVYTVGNDVSNGTAELNSSQLILTQLQDQRNSVSGVDLNQEAANMVEYQRAYDAAAQVVTTINDMLNTVINMGTLT
jgi:flagellar hook-associated protein 1 FlgK